MDAPLYRCLRLMAEGPDWQRVSDLHTRLGRDCRAVDQMVAAGLAAVRSERQGKRGPLARLVHLTAAGDAAFAAETARRAAAKAA